MAEFLGSKTISNQFLGNKVILRTYKGDNLINEYEPLYNPPSDWSDIRTDCPENSIALYVAQGFGLLIAGSPSSSNGIATGFDSSNYFYVDNFPMNSKTNWEINIKANTEFNGNQQRVLCLPSGYLRCIGSTPNWNLIIDGQEFWLDEVSNFPYVKIKRDGNKIYGYNSSDGETFTLKGTIENATLSDGTLSFGGAAYGSLPWAGSIDMRYTSVKVDDSSLRSYDNLGFTATCSDGYKVYIDGVQYGTTYASGTTCSITWSTSGITTGNDITTPSAMKAHKIWISPATEGNNITIFRCKRVATSGTEQQGILWAHFNIDYKLSSIPAFGDESNQFRNTLLESVTAKGNKLRVSNLYYAFYNCNSLEYTPEFVLPSSFSYYLSATFANTNIEKIVLKDTSFTNIRMAFQNCQKVKKIILKDVDLSSLTRADNFITNASSLEDITLDLSSATDLTVVGCYGTSSYFMNGFKGLRVSNQAPFNHVTAPQINVSYTGMDRSALVQLFNDLPYNVGYEVVGNPTITDGIVSGLNGSNFLEINKSLTITPSTKAVFNMRLKSPESIESEQFYTAMYAETSYERVFAIYSIPGYPLKFSLGFGLGNMADVELNTWYRPRIIFNGNGTVSGYLYDDNGNLINSKTIDYTDTKFCSKFYMGIPTPAIVFDLNNTNIEFDEVYWFRGQPAMTKTINVVGCLGNQLNTVGSPTISDGIVSVSSNSDIVKTAQSFIYNNNGKYEIYTRFKTPQTLSGVNSVFGKIDIWTTPVLYVTENSLLFRLPDNSELYSGFSNINADTYYRTKIVGNYGVWTIWLYSDSGVQIATASKDISETSAQSSGVLLIDSFYGNSYPVQYVDLNETYIKVNNNTWFDINNCLLPEDRAIVTDKGWAITYQ